MGLQFTAQAQIPLEQDPAMETRIIPKAAEIVSDAAAPLSEAAARLGAGATLADEAGRLLGRETSTVSAAAETTKFNLADPRTYSARFTSPTEPDQKRIYSSVEAIAAIVRNSTRTDAKLFETPVDVQNLFGRVNLHAPKIERTAEYLQKATGLEMTPQAVRFRDHNAVPGHYVMFVKGYDGIDRIAYGRVQGPRDSYIFEPLKGKEFSWQQLSQFNRRVIAAHRLDLPGTNAVGTATSIELARAQPKPPLAPNLINPPDERGGISRLTGFQGVAAMLRNDIRKDAGFENALDVERAFGDTKLARTLEPAEARIFGRHYIQMASGTQLGRPVPFTDALERPGQYAVFFDGYSKLPQSALLRVTPNGAKELYYPRFDRVIKPEDIRDRNPIAYLATAKTPLPDKSSMDFSTLTDAKLIPLEHATRNEIDASVFRLLPFHARNNQLKQNFIIETEGGHKMRVVHNTSDGSGLVPLEVGSKITLNGEYVVDPAGYGVFHWTHRGGMDEFGNFAGGWIRLDGKRYW
jgi:hypothetical protein